MTNNPASQLLAAYLKKHAAEMPQQLDPALLGGQSPDGSAEHEQAESPEHEMAEHQPGGYEAGGEEGGHGHEAEIEQLLSQLSPEELEQLTNELAGDMHGAGGHEGTEHGGTSEDVPGVADAIHSHLTENPEAQLPPGAAPEKVAALEFVKSAAYIEGFVEQAVNRGASIKQAVDMYDEALAKTINNLKVASQMPGMIMAKTKIDKMTTKTPHAPNLMNSVKTAAYYEGVIERAREYGLSDQEAVDFVKSAMMSGGVPAAIERSVSRPLLTSAELAMRPRLSELEHGFNQNPRAQALQKARKIRAMHGHDAQLRQQALEMARTGHPEPVAVSPTPVAATEKSVTSTPAAAKAKAKEEELAFADYLRKHIRGGAAAIGANPLTSAGIGLGALGSAGLTGAYLGSDS